MTKAELIEALKDFPDDMKVKTIDAYGYWDIKTVREAVDPTLNEKFILVEF